MVERKRVKFRVVSVKGKAYDRGKMYGREVKNQINENVNFYLDLWQKFGGASREKVLKLAEERIPMIEDFDAEIMDEIRGIAKGAGLTVEEIAALNARYEFNRIFAKVPLEVHGCTSVAVMPEASSSAMTYIGQNWDYRPQVKDRSVILKIQQDDGKPDIMIHAEAGVIGHKGLNSAGIGLTVNYLISKEDAFDKEGVPLWVICRGILNSKSLGDAVKVILRAKRAVSANYCIAHVDGETIDIEATPSDVGYMFPEGGILTHANNFVPGVCPHPVVDMSKLILPDSPLRTRRSYSLLKRLKGKITEEDIMKAFRDHFNFPKSICRHIDIRDSEPMQAETLASVIINLNEKTMSIAYGPPCGHEYTKIKLAEKLK